MQTVDTTRWKFNRANLCKHKETPSSLPAVLHHNVSQEELTLSDWDAGPGQGSKALEASIRDLFLYINLVFPQVRGQVRYTNSTVDISEGRHRAKTSSYG